MSWHEAIQVRTRTATRLRKPFNQRKYYVQINLENSSDIIPTTFFIEIDILLLPYWFLFSV